MGLARRASPITPTLPVMAPWQRPVAAARRPCGGRGVAWVTPCASSTVATSPDPPVSPGAVGLNTTLIVHEWATVVVDAASEMLPVVAQVPGAVVDRENGAVITMLATGTVSADEPEVKVSVRTLLVWFRFTNPKPSSAGSAVASNCAPALRRRSRYRVPRS